MEYAPYTRSDQQQLPLYYIEPDVFDDDFEYTGVLVIAYAAPILHMNHSKMNQGLEDAALRYNNQNL